MEALISTQEWAVHDVAGRGFNTGTLLFSSIGGDLGLKFHTTIPSK